MRKIKALIYVVISMMIESYYDVDGTLVHEDGSLTELGQMVRVLGIEIRVITFGPWSIELLGQKGIKVTSLVTAGQALIEGLADTVVTVDGHTVLSKKVSGLLIDNARRLLRI